MVLGVPIFMQIRVLKRVPLLSIRETFEILLSLQVFWIVDMSRQKCEAW